MSSNEDQQQSSASAAIPLLLPHKKKQTGKPKARVRPTRALKKNGPPKRKLVPSNKIPTVGGSQVTVTPSAVQKDGLSSIISTVGLAPVSTPGATKPQPSKSKVLPRKPVRKAAKAIRPSKISSAAKKGLSINVGSSMNKVSSIRAGSSRINARQSQPQQQVEAIPEREEQIQSTQITPMSDALVESERATPETVEGSPNEIKDANEVEIIPYQHLGQIDPTLNIAPPKASEKTMKDFCSKFKIPKSQLTNNEENNNNANNTNNVNNPAEGTGNNDAPNTTAGSTDLNAPAEEPKDNRSGPLVEIINGEIVIKESSMIVGGRRTTEEVDRELEGTIVVEENTGITATYNSFTKRQKTQRWSVDETRKFYVALRQCGTDFSTMESFFDGADEGNERTRKQLKSKYKRECRNNLNLIDMAMDPKVQLPLDMSVFGELDMEAVGAVVPLGQASVPSGGINSNDTGAAMASVQSLGTTPLQTSVDDGEPEVVVEIFGEENVAPAVVTQTQDTSETIPKVGGVNAAAAAPPAAVTPAAAAVEEENNIPLLSMPTTTKRKPRPKFRASRAKPKAKPGSKGKAKPKRTVK